MALSPNASDATEARLAQLRHDLLNPLNVLTGATTALLETELTDAQRRWVQMLRSTTARLLEIVEHIEDVTTESASSFIEGRARLADLLSIAAARVGKPFNRQQLVDAIQGVGGRRPLRILLVDDSPELVLLVRTFLNGTNWDLEVVENGERAVAQAQSESYDVVLMDIDLPGLDGATAAHAIRAADLARGASPTPIIAMTAFDSASARTEPPASFGETSSASARTEPPASFGETSSASARTEPPAGFGETSTAGETNIDVVTIADPEVAPLIPEFLENRRSEVSLLRTALTASEFRRIESLAHNMKGSGRGYGFTVISRLGGDLELAARQQDVPRITTLIDELEAYLGKVQVSCK